jgi:hypothetical protein
MRLATATLIAIILAVSACSEPPPGIEAPCRLVREGADGGVAFIPVGDPGYDSSTAFISTGDPDCAELLCVRVAHPSASFYSDSDGFLHGQCTTLCTIDGPDGHSRDCGVPEQGLQCQHLGLDASNLSAFCSASPDDCASSADAGPAFCVDPLASGS